MPIIVATLNKNLKRQNIKIVGAWYNIGRSVRSTTIASVLQIPTPPPPTTTTPPPPIIPKKWRTRHSSGPC